MADRDPDPASAPLDELAKKKALRMITNGLYIIGCAHGERVHGMLGSWVTQVSFKPPRVAVGIRNDSLTHELIDSSDVFAVNVLGLDQRDVAEDFLKGITPKDGHLGEHAFETGATGCPLLEEAPAWFECRVVERANDDGDHTLFIGEVIQAGFRRLKEPLNIWDTGWHYGG